MMGPRALNGHETVLSEFPDRVPVLTARKYPEALSVFSGQGIKIGALRFLREGQTLKRFPVEKIGRGIERIFVAPRK